MKVAGYIRVSSARQVDDGQSLEAQEAAIRARVDAEPDWELVEPLFEDAGITGSGKAKRPGIEGMLAALDDLDVVVITELSRLGRNAAGMLELFRQLTAADVRLVATRQAIDTSTATGRLLPNLMAVLAQWEAELLGERVKAVAEHNSRAGRHHGPAPTGYVRKDKRLVPDPVMAPVVKRVYAEAAAGQAQATIAQGLNRDGVKPRRAKQWTQTQIGAMLRNPVYRGAVILNGVESEGEHAPLIDAEQWAKVSTERERRALSHKGGPGRAPAGAHLFVRGLLRCGHCGEAMLPRTERGREGGRRGRHREEYRCAGREKLKNGCPQSIIPRAALDSAMFGYLRAAGVDLEATRAHLQGEIDRRREAIDAQLEVAERERAKAAEAIPRIRGDYKSGELSAADYATFKTELEEELAAAEAALAQAQKREAEIADASGDDAGEVAVNRLAALQLAVAGSVTDGVGDIEAVRLRLRSAFESVHVYRRDVLVAELASDAPEDVAIADDTRALLRDDLSAGGEGEWVVRPILADEAIEGLGDVPPSLQPEAFPFADNNQGSSTPM